MAVQSRGNSRSPASSFVDVGALERRAFAHLPHTRVQRTPYQLLEVVRIDGRRRKLLDDDPAEGEGTIRIPEQAAPVDLEKALMFEEALSKLPNDHRIAIMDYLDQESPARTALKLNVDKKRIGAIRQQGFNRLCRLLGWRKAN